MRGTGQNNTISVALIDKGLAKSYLEQRRPFIGAFQNPGCSIEGLAHSVVDQLEGF